MTPLPMTMLVMGVALFATPPPIQSPSPLPVPSPTISLSFSHGPPVTEVIITGAGFPPGASLVLYWDDRQRYCAGPGPIADAQGGFKRSCFISGVNPGRHQFCADTGPPPNVDEPVKVIACATFVVSSGAGSTPTTSVVSDAQHLSLADLVAGVLFVVAVAFGALTYWLRRQDRGI
jgi:hypothetical protein